MGHGVMRAFVEKKPGADVAARQLLADLKENLGMKALEGLRILIRYDVEGLTKEEFLEAAQHIFAELAVDTLYLESLPFGVGQTLVATEFLPGQYDQRADSAAQCVQLLTQKERPLVRMATLYVLEGALSLSEVEAFKAYVINPVEAREAALEKPKTLETDYPVAEDVEVLEGFLAWEGQTLEEAHARLGLSMSLEDWRFCQDYFREEQRDPSLTEVRVIDTYWSDHCRHTTFNTILESIEIQEGEYRQALEEALEAYLALRKKVHGGIKPQSLMDMATVHAKAFRQDGKLEDLDVSEEINACSIKVEAEIWHEGQMKKVPYLVMFKNETHNHPTEIEPFGGAATCIGGAIRDPLSGRSYVYQAMRVTGCANPLEKIEDTLPGKLPQRTITRLAAQGYSSYGNQIGLATGLVDEVYHPGYKAKRMEIGAVVGAAPEANVIREIPAAGDLILLLGGRTGRDGCGGATGSSKAHNVESLEKAGSEVQKGNAPTERKLQRLYRNPNFTRKIKRCNDFGAGGVSVAIGELTDSLEIELDAVPKKYEGLDGTELAISESQERMAVVIDPRDLEEVLALAEQENLEATVVAKVADHGRLIMRWRGTPIVNLSRHFLDTSGVTQKARAIVRQPEGHSYFHHLDLQEKNIQRLWVQSMGRLNQCSKKGMIDRFDSTIGAATVTMPLGGKRQETPIQAMVAKLPSLEGESQTATWMSYGFDPALSQWSPFHGGLYAVVDALTKLAAAGGDPLKARMSFQEYYERLEKDPLLWGKPVASLLGAHTAMNAFEVPAIGGKDSMSGTFHELTVPPTLCAFALTVGQAAQARTPEFKSPGNILYLLASARDDQDQPDFEQLKKHYRFLLSQRSRVVSAAALGRGGLATALARCAFGNDLGIQLEGHWNVEGLFLPAYGSLLLEVNHDQAAVFEAFALEQGVAPKCLGHLTKAPVIVLTEQAEEPLALETLRQAWRETLEPVFPTRTREEGAKLVNQPLYTRRSSLRPRIQIARPRVCIPVFPGTNCEYDTAAAFEKAGGRSEVLILRNLTPQAVEESILRLERSIRQSQIIMIPGGFSGGDEPDGSGKLIATTFRNPRIKAAVEELLEKRDGLILGICNGFQALIKLGLVPYGKIVDMTPESPTLTFNTIGRHISGLYETQITSVLSPWMSGVQAGDRHTLAFSHGEGRIHGSLEELEALLGQGQVCSQYVDSLGQPTMEIQYNPNGSLLAIEGLSSPDGRVLGKMGHSERVGSHLYRNVPGEYDQKIFQSGVRYFTE